MAVIIFSTKFPSYHPRKGEPTFFVEKIWSGMPFLKPADITTDAKEIFNNYLSAPYDEYNIKYHTIRAGNRWKVGDKFSPRIWSGKPYCSKQIIFAPDIEIKQIWKFEIKEREILVNDKISGSSVNLDISMNDGLQYKDFLEWVKFPNPFLGQIICWSNEKINY